MTEPTLTAAFVLRSHAYGESDRIVRFITEDFGKVSGMDRCRATSSKSVWLCAVPSGS